jgi:aminoglycoside phosphotransferase (APT) family kinase protein
MSKVNIVETLESSGPLVCIVHGDYWNHNILFKYEDGIPVSLPMLDFQLSRIGHPLGDVAYFLYTSTLPETRQKYLHDLLCHYFDTLTTDLRLLVISLDNYNMDNIWADFKNSSLKWMFRSIMALSMSQNKQVVTNLKEADAKQLKQPKLEGITTSFIFYFSAFIRGLGIMGYDCFV